MRLGVVVEGDLRKIIGAGIDSLSIVVTDAVDRNSLGLRDELRRQVVAAGLGGDVAKAWQQRRYPARRNSMGAAGWVYSKSRRIHEAFSGARTVTARGSRYLAVPLSGAVKRLWHLGGKGGLIGAKPRKWSDFGQVLQMKGVAWIKRPDGRVLVALRKGRQFEPLFLLTKSVRLKGGLDLAGPPQRWLNKLHAELTAALGG